MLEYFYRFWYALRKGLLELHLGILGYKGKPVIVTYDKGEITISWEYLSGFDEVKLPEQAKVSQLELVDGFRLYAGKLDNEDLELRFGGDALATPISIIFRGKRLPLYQGSRYLLYPRPVFLPMSVERIDPNNPTFSVGRRWRLSCNW